jgi:LPXTG-motif cell wall-anchored protein
MLTSFFPNISRAGMFEVGKEDIFPSIPSGFTIDCCAVSKPLPNLGMGQFQNFTDYIDAFPFDKGSEGLSSSHISDVPGWGGGALFITGSITSTQNSIPDSSTMLLLGLGLVGLSGYFGRRKFKR